MGGARRLSEAEWAERAVPAQERVFAALDPYESPFADSVRERALLFPVRPDLEPRQLAALRVAAMRVGDASYFFTSLVYEEEGWEIPVEEEPPDEAFDGLNPIASAFFGPSGLWGMLVAEEDHAVVGGARPFMEVIAEHFPPTEEPDSFAVAPDEPRPRVELPQDAPVEARIEEILDRYVGGSTEIELRTGEPFGDAQVLAFVEFWKVWQRDSPWLPGLLAHLYGAERAERLLAAGDW